MGNWKGTKMITIQTAGKCAFAAALVLTVLVVGARGAPADEPVFHEGVLIQVAGKPIDIEIGHLVPRACDWNNDGKKDLLVGQFSGGVIRLYLNQGTDAAPVFEDSTVLNAGGKPIKLDAG